jgi:cyclopropane-fatty-acyl-phospholipid synthase
MTSLRLESTADREAPPEQSTTTPPGPDLEAQPRPGFQGGPIGHALGWLLRRQLKGVPVDLVLPGGTRLAAQAGPPVATVFIKDFGVLARLPFNSEVAFGEAFEAGRVEVHGDLIGLLEAVFRQQLARRALGGRPTTPTPERSHGLRSARRNIHHHYDLGNDFYRLWLDRELVYTCAYYPSPDDDLDTAQVAKMEHVCRKLRLQPGERVVEAGCGWGALALYMVRRYGVTVRAFNVSVEQIRWARERARREGLDGRVEFVDDDYRNIRGGFDVFVSIGMLEHVGPPNYRVLGEVIHRGLPEASGRGLIHFIGRNRPAPPSAWTDKRLFPGSYPPALAEMIQGVLEPRDFSVLDVENLRLHYARTLRHWHERFEVSADKVAAMFDERFVRAWRLYLTGSQAAFRSGGLQLFQVVFARGCDKQIPWTRIGPTFITEDASAPHGTP